MVVGLVETDSKTKTQLQTASQRAIKRIDKDFSGKMDDFWDLVFAVALEKCPVETGTLASSIRVVDGAFDPSGFSGVSVTVNGMGGYGAVERSIVAGGEEYINPKTHGPCDYASYVEVGHMTKNGGFVEGAFFLTDALNECEPQLDEILNGFADDVEKEFCEGSKGSPP